MATGVEVEPSVRTYVAILRQQRWYVACATLLGLAAGVVFAFTMPKQYSATAQVLVQPPGQSVISGAAPITSTDVQTELQLVTSAPVESRVSRQLGGIPNVTAAEVAQTNVIAITATSTSPARSALIANTYARDFVAYQRTVAIDSLTAAERQLRSQIAAIGREIKASGSGSAEASALISQQSVLREQLAQMRVSGVVAGGGVELVTPAQRPGSASSPRPVEDILLGALAGLLAGLAIAFLRNNLNDTLASKEAVEDIGGAPVLTMVPTVASWRKRDRALVVAHSEPTSPAAESYRSLRTSIQFIRHDRELRTVVITSPAASEGKTSTLANLGTVFAQAGERVALVSCDLRRPRIGQFFGLDEQSGFTSILLGQQTLAEAMQPMRGHKNLWLLGAGTLPHNPAELLNGSEARSVFAALREEFDLVLIDSPPVLPVTDAVVLSTFADATLLVVAAGQTRRADLRRAAEKLAQVNVPIAGIVLNEVSKQVGYDHGYGYRYGYQSYSAHPAESHGTHIGNGHVTPANIGQQ